LVEGSPYPRRHFTFDRSPVAVKVIQQLYRTDDVLLLNSALKPTICCTTPRRKSTTGFSQRDFSTEPEATKQNSKARDDSNRRPRRKGGKRPSHAPPRRRFCFARARKDRVFIDSLGMASPSLFRSLDIETFISPIKPIPDGWDESIPDGWDDDDDLLEGI
jgi:hypothetical protein